MLNQRHKVLLVEGKEEQAGDVGSRLEQKSGDLGGVAHADSGFEDASRMASDIRITETGWSGATPYLVALGKITACVHLERGARIARQAADQSSQIASQFLANVSHELRTPLNSIIGFSDLMLAGLRSDVRDDEQREYLRYIRSSGAHLLELINGILDLSKAEAGQLELAVEKCDVRELLDVTVRALETQAAAKSIRIQRQPVARGLAVMADKIKIGQVLLNLASNAVKFTDEGGEVTIAAIRMTSGEVRFTVSDTGVGMPASMIPKAFAAFSRAGNAYTTRRKAEGVGLGLALARRLTEIHGGTIAMESEEGRGSKVTVMLPPERTTDLPYPESSPGRRADAN